MLWVVQAIPDRDPVIRPYWTQRAHLPLDHSFHIRINDTIDMNESSPLPDDRYRRLRRAGGVAILVGIFGPLIQQILDTRLPPGPTGAGDIDGSVADLANLMLLSVFVLVNAALLNLRYSHPELERGFRAPVNVGWLSVTAVAGLASSLGLIGFDIVTW